MRGAVAVACALLPFMLFGTQPVAAQEPLRVIRELRFEGNRAIPDEVIASAIATTNSSWFARTFLFRWLGLGEKRYFDEQEFRRDVVRIEVLYRRSGYPQALVDTTVVRDPLNVFITFRIAEGPPIRVVKLATNGLDSLREVATYRYLPSAALTLRGLFAGVAPQELSLVANFATADPVAETKRKRDRKRALRLQASAEASRP